ncbi:MAG: hypothetical protein ACI9NT_001744 [Bacteroidia bacterium]|jgi:hypothetical protein
MNQAMTNDNESKALVDCRYILTPQQVHFFDSFGVVQSIISEPLCHRLTTRKQPQYASAQF